MIRKSQGIVLSNNYWLNDCDWLRSEFQFLRDLVQSTIGIEVSMAKWLKEAHMVGVSVDNVNVVSILWFYHQLRVVVKTLREDIDTKKKGLFQALPKRKGWVGLPMSKFWAFSPIIYKSVKVVNFYSKLMIFVHICFISTIIINLRT